MRSAPGARALALALLLFVTPQAAASDASEGARVTAMLEPSLDWAEDGADVYVESELGLWLPLTERVAFRSAVLLEPVRARRRGEDRWLDDHGLFVESAALELGDDSVELTLGKFTPTFGLVWQLAPGVFAPDLPEEHELTERVGAGLSIAGPRVEDRGALRVSAAAFQRDTTFLSASVLANRGRLERDAGGAGNHTGLRSWAAALDVLEIAGVPDLRARFAWLSQVERGRGRTHEVLLAAASRHRLPFGVEVAPLAELVFASGRPASDRPEVQGTLALAFERGPWRASFSQAWREARAGGGDGDGRTGERRERRIMASLGRRFDEGRSVDIAVRVDRRERETSHLLGVRVRVSWEWISPRSRIHALRR